jgi:hypothetical protein
VLSDIFLKGMLFDFQSGVDFPNGKRSKKNGGAVLKARELLSVNRLPQSSNSGSFS